MTNTVSYVAAKEQGIRPPPAITDGRVPGGRLRLVRGSLARALGYVGAFFVVAGVVEIAHGGVPPIVIGALMGVPLIREQLDRRKSHRQDLADAATLRKALGTGQSPEAIEPLKLRAEGQHLDPGEACYVDGCPVQVLSFYGDFEVQTRGFFWFFGGPLAFLGSLIGNLLLHDWNKKRRRNAAPRWRDPEPALLWATSTRYIVHGLTGNRSWVQLPFNRMLRTQAESDGIVLILADAPNLPMKLKSANPAWHYALLQHLSHSNQRR